MVYILLIAILLDLLIGDPRFYPHPVVIMGKIINSLEKYLYKEDDSPRVKKTKGALLVVIVLTIIFVAIYLIITLAFNIDLIFGVIVQILILYSMIAIKGLKDAGLDIYNKLKNKELMNARKALDLIVGRNTCKLDEAEIIRAVIETLAENTSDGIIAPIFYFMLGGPILSVLYKAVNTMDSMLGHKNNRYIDFGWAAARLDDLMNYIPARLTAFFFITASIILQKDFLSSFKTVFADASKHDSPNAGYPEAAVAGALGLRLGGMNYYSDHQTIKAYLGKKSNEFEKRQIKDTIRLININITIFIITYTVVTYFMS